MTNNPRSTTEQQDKAIANLISKGLSYRNVARLFFISPALVEKIVKRNSVVIVDKLKGRVCVLCGAKSNFIDNNFYTICSKCQKKLQNLSK